MVTASNLGEDAVNKTVSRLFWIEAALGTLTLLLALMTPVFPDWIEAISGWDPDQHDGTVESWIVFGLFAATIVIFALAFFEWRRAPASTSA
jgi:protein-S-isoprenylcysteine O-methyltransferase Ste14